MSARGRGPELDTLTLLRDAGHIAYRIAHGPADLIAMGGGLPRPLFVQVKKTRKPYDHFGQADRAALLEEAALAGADPVLCWWPPRQGRKRYGDIPVWLHPADWPALKVAA